MAGFSRYPFVTGFLTTDKGPVPQVATSLSARDILGTVAARLGLIRDNYRITPGLYGIGEPSPDSQVIVTANYKLTFDSVRKALRTLNVWLLVVDTRGINVWCAAGKKTFSTEEVAYQVARSQLKSVVSHTTLILPQLAAPGVAAHRLLQLCGFRGRFGPVQIQDLPAFLDNNMQADERMRSVTFSLRERTAVIPVELVNLFKPLVTTSLIMTVLSGVSKHGYSIDSALQGGMQFLLATLLAIVTGAVLTPILLPYIPGRQFWIKGALTSLAAIVIVLPFAYTTLTVLRTAALICWVIASGSYIAMNFTGSTPFTSLTGVEIELRRGLALQIVLTLSGLVCWGASLFM